MERRNVYELERDPLELRSKARRKAGHRRRRAWCVGDDGQEKKQPLSIRWPLTKPTTMMEEEEEQKPHHGTAATILSSKDDRMICYDLPCFSRALRLCKMRYLHALSEVDRVDGFPRFFFPIPPKIGQVVQRLRCGYMRPVLDRGSLDSSRVHCSKLEEGRQS